jgi:mannose-6-phosphate isomerase-like protein (cupin superfamily)
MSLKDKVFEKNIVKKPWGYEYIIYRNQNKLALTFLDIKYNKQTSLHCHPKKKTGFILISGKAKIQLGLYKETAKIYKAPNKLMIRTGLFHTIKAISKDGIKALEFETPVIKNDLVRYQDKYGRQLKPYEGKKHFTKIKKNFVKFKNPKINKQIIYNIDNRKIYIENHKNFKKLIKQPSTYILGVLKGAITDKLGKEVLTLGDIIRIATIKKLAKKFKIKKNITTLIIKD